MLLEKKPFGNIAGQKIEQFIMENEQGLSVRIITYGATITSISIPGKNGQRHDLVCGFNTIEGYQNPDYQDNAPYFGCTVGRYASRIKDGKFSIDHTEYQLAVNDGSNHLHGGLKGFDKHIWSAAPIESDGEIGVVMSRVSPHMEEGYPGNLTVQVTFLLNNNNELEIRYEATGDQTTPVSLTNHSYFNLSGFNETIGNHRATIWSEAYLQPDETNVPIGPVTKVEKTAADLRSGNLLKESFKELETGFEHYFLFDHGTDTLKKVAEFVDQISGRKLVVFTTEPGMLFYTGYYTSAQLQRESGDQYGRFRAFCCETHRYPNGPNIENSPGSLTKPGEKYTSTTRFKFHW